MAVKYAILIISICLRTQADLKSPCPNVFLYQSRDDSTDRWYGLFHLESHEKTVGVQLKLILDKPALRLGNLFGKTITYDLKEFIITNTYFELEPNSSHLLRFYVAYDPNKALPALTSIEQNDRIICPNQGRSDQDNVFISVLIKPIAEPNTRSLQLGPVDQSLNEMECGTITPQASPLIAGGEESEVGAYPWHVAIYYMKKYGCGGSLVSKQLVVTTVRCLATDLVDTKDIEIHLGKQYLEEISPKVQIRNISERIPHPRFNQSSRIFNIGLLKLKEPIIFSDFVKPVCLNSPDTDFEKLIGKIGTIPGYGSTETEFRSETLRYATMKVVSYQDCLSKSTWYYVNRNSFCAIPVNGSVPCSGDGGAGLVFPDNSNARRIYYLRGIVSHGIRRCDGSNHQVFTDVVENLNFIKACNMF